MQFHDFLEAKYVKTNIALQQVYHPRGQGIVGATQKLIHMQRTFLTYLYIPVILFQYVLVQLRILPSPPSSTQLVEEMKAASEAKQVQAKAGLDMERQALIANQLASQKAE